MIFGKRKDMIDISELQKQGKIISSTNEVNIPTDKDGFIEVGNSFQSKKNPINDNNDVQRLNSRIQEMDRIIYKLEQRIELLERKLGVDNGTPPTINW